MTQLENRPQLTPEQQAIVAHPPNRHARVLAGPGAGKSFTAIAYLEHWTAQQPDLAARMITFTRAATEEFTTRLGDRALAGPGIETPSTIHAFALRLLIRLRAKNLPHPIRIPGSWEVKDIISPMLRDHLRGSAEGTWLLITRDDAGQVLELKVDQAGHKRLRGESRRNSSSCAGGVVVAAAETLKSLRRGSRMPFPVVGSPAASHS